MLDIRKNDRSVVYSFPPFGMNKFQAFRARGSCTGVRTVIAVWAEVSPHFSPGIYVEIFTTYRCHLNS